MIRRSLLGVTLFAAVALLVQARAADKILFEKESPYNTVVVVEDDRGLRTLQFERYGARQSVVKVGDPDHIELPYAKTMFAGLALMPDPQRILIVGLGGGTIPVFLHKHYPKATIDVVDIDPVVVAVAREYFDFREDAKLRAHVADGRKFIEECRKPYDVIFLDAFSADSIPYTLATQEFLKAVRRAASPRGVVLSNIWDRFSNPLYDEMLRTYRSVFDEVCVMEVRASGNRIVVALPRDERIDPKELARRAGRLSREKGFRFNMRPLVEYGCHCGDQLGEGARILLDEDDPDRKASVATKPAGA